MLFGWSGCVVGFLSEKVDLWVRSSAFFHIFICTWVDRLGVMVGLTDNSRPKRKATKSVAVLVMNEFICTYYI